MNQLGFNFTPHPKERGKARRSDPASSHQAASNISVVLSEQKRNILLTLLAHHPRKLTCKEIAERLNEADNAISSRFKDLIAAGLVVNGSNDEREAYKSKTRQLVRGLSEQGLVEARRLKEEQ